MLRIKNWEKFQHYKHRDPPWIRLYRGLLNDREWHNLDGDAAKALVMCWLIASEREGALPEPKDLAFRLRITEKQLASIVLKLSHWVEQVASTALAERGQHALPETETETETETEQKDSGAVASATRPVVDEDFEKFWKAYPKREGGNPKTPARKSFLTALKAGADPAKIISAAAAYAAHPSTKVGTPYVTQAVTWLNQKRWEDHVSGDTETAADVLERHRLECLKRPPETRAQIRGNPGMGQNGADHADELRPSGGSLRSEGEAMGGQLAVPFARQGH